MNPELEKLAAHIRKMRRELPDLTPQEIDEFVREQTGGKFGARDLPRPLAIPMMAGVPGGSATVSDPDVALRVANSAAFGGLDELLSVLGLEKGNQAIDAAGKAVAEKGGPVAGIAADLLGALPTMRLGAAIPLSGIRNAAVRTGAAVGAGGAAGAATGALSAEEGHRAEGAAMGGMFGAAVPAAVAGGTELVRAVRPSVRAARHVLDDILNMKPEGVNANTALGDIVSGARAAEAKGTPSMLGAEPGLRRGGLDYAATQSPRAASQIEEVVQDLQAQQSRRLVSSVEAELGGRVPTLQNRVSALAKERQVWAASDEGFEGLRKMNPNVAVSVETTVPELRALWRKARLAGDIQEPPVPPGVAAILKGAKTPGKTQGPRAISFQDMHDFKQLLDAQAESAFSTKRGSLGRAYADLGRFIDDLLKESVPDYGPRAATYRMMKQKEEAVAAGAKAWTSGTFRFGGRERSIRDGVAFMPPEVLNEFRTGMASAIVKGLEDPRTNQRIAQRLVDRSIRQDDVLRTVFGSRTKDFLETATREAELSKAANAVGGSQTAARTAAANMEPFEMAGVAGAVPPGAAPVAVGARIVPGFMRRKKAEAMVPWLTAKGPLDISKALREILEQSGPPVTNRSLALPLATGQLSGLMGDR